MRKESKNPGFKLRLLALVLALALLWYSLNPAPYTSPRRRRADDEPGAKKREVEPELSRAPLSLTLYKARPREAFPAYASTAEETDDFDWPEFIDG